MRHLAPGVYDDDGTMHLVLDELLEAEGWPATPENIHQVECAAREFFDGQGIPVQVDDTFFTDRPGDEWRRDD